MHLCVCCLIIENQPPDFTLWLLNIGFQESRYWQQIWNTSSSGTEGALDKLRVCGYESFPKCSKNLSISVTSGFLYQEMCTIECKCASKTVSVVAEENKAGGLLYNPYGPTFPYRPTPPTVPILFRTSIHRQAGLANFPLI